jgi:hypothetical protein
LSYNSSPFCSGCFGDGVSWAICPGWSQNMILQMARIRGSSHQCLSILIF